MFFVFSHSAGCSRASNERLKNVPRTSVAGGRFHKHKPFSSFAQMNKVCLFCKPYCLFVISRVTIITLKTFSSTTLIVYQFTYGYVLNVTFKEISQTDFLDKRLGCAFEFSHALFLFFRMFACDNKHSQHTH